MDVCLMGRIGYDLYADQQNVPLEKVTSFSRYLGGSSANMAVGLSRLGLRTEMISCLGDDPIGKYLVEVLRQEKVGTRFVVLESGALASLCLTEVSPPDRFPQVFYREAAADCRLVVKESELQAIEKARLFVTNGTSLAASPSRESTFYGLERAHAAGVKVAFDVDFRAMSWKNRADAGLYVRLALPFLDALIANPEEICLVADASEVDEAIRKLRGKIPLLVAKLGSRGTRVVTPDQSLFLPPYPVPVVSTIGAGDGFASGFLYGLVKEMPLERCLQYGNAAAAIVVGRLMCAQAMPRLEEIEALIAGHPENQARQNG